MNDTSIRYACMDDYPEVEKIMQQVQNMHVTWRPDIYKDSDIVLPREVFEDAVRKATFVVAEHNGQVIGLLFFMIGTLKAVIKSPEMFSSSTPWLWKRTFAVRGLGIGFLNLPKK